METTVDGVLEHFGVKGMKWGVRKNRVQVAHPKSEEAARVHEILGNIHKNGIGAASNSDLKLLEQRMKLEVKYNELFPKKQPVIDFGSAAVKKVLLPIAEQQAKNFLSQKATTLVAGKTIVEELELGKHSAGYGRHLKR